MCKDEATELNYTCICHNGKSHQNSTMACLEGRTSLYHCLELWGITKNWQTLNEGMFDGRKRTYLRCISSWRVPQPQRKASRHLAARQVDSVLENCLLYPHELFLLKEGPINPLWDLYQTLCLQHYLPLTLPEGSVWTSPELKSQQVPSKCLEYSHLQFKAAAPTFSISRKSTTTYLVTQIQKLGVTADHSLFLMLWCERARTYGSAGWWNNEPNTLNTAWITWFYFALSFPTALEGGSYISRINTSHTGDDGWFGRVVPISLSSVPRGRRCSRDSSRGGTHPWRGRSASRWAGASLRAHVNCPVSGTSGVSLPLGLCVQPLI